MGRLVFGFVSGPFAEPAFEQAKKQKGLEYDYILIPGQTADIHGGVYRGEFLAVLNTKKADAAWKWQVSWPTLPK
jgi:multiple sugar transport system substrate-binding protein